MFTWIESENGDGYLVEFETPITDFEAAAATLASKYAVELDAIDFFDDTIAQVWIAE